MCTGEEQKLPQQKRPALKHLLISNMHLVCYPKSKVLQGGLWQAFDGGGVGGGEQPYSGREMEGPWSSSLFVECTPGPLCTPVTRLRGSQSFPSPIPLHHVSISFQYDNNGCELGGMRCILCLRQYTGKPQSQEERQK